MPPSTFRFRLERIRALREQHEQQAKASLAGALERQAHSEAELQAISGRLVSAREQQREAAIDPHPSAAEVLAREAFVERMEAQQADGRLVVRNREREVAERDAQLRHAATEHRMLQRLKERRRAEFLREGARREGALLDEIAVERHGRSAA